MTRVAHLLSHHPHPSHSFLRDEVTGLREAGLEVETIALNPPADEHILTELDRCERDRTRYVKSRFVPTALAALIDVGRRHPVRLARFILGAALDGMPDPVLAMRRATQAVEAVVVLRWCRQLGVDHVHAHFGGAPGTVARYAAMLSRRLNGDRPLSWSITVHGPHDFMNERTSNLAALAGSADLVVAISDFTAAQLLRLVPASRRSRVTVVRCGIDLELFTPQDRPGDQYPADDRSVTKRSLHVVTLGRMAPEKGQWVLIDSVARLVDRGHDVSLRIIGDGDLRADLVRQVDDLGLADRIEFLGLIDPASVRSEIARADLFCLPSFAEGLPVALMEAAAVGTPIVCTSVAGIPELVIDGTTGRCVPAGSSSELVAAIEQLIVDPPSRRAMAEAARARVEARHDRRTNTHRLAQLLRDVAAEGRQEAS